MWISHNYVYLPSFFSLTPLLPRHPSRSSQNTILGSLCYTATSHQLSISLMITPVLRPPHAKTWLIGKDSDAGRHWGQEEKGTTEDEMAGRHHQLDGHESEQAPGDGRSYSPWGHKQLDTTERLNWTELEIRRYDLTHWSNLIAPTKYKLPLCPSVGYEGLLDKSKSRTVYKIPLLYNLQKCQGHETQRPRNCPRLGECDETWQLSTRHESRLDP